LIHEGKDMKKILLATTILGMTAGFAAAEVKFSGSASAGFARDGVISDDSVDTAIHAYSTAKLGVEFVGETDGGLTFGATLSIKAGRSYDFDEGDGFNDESGASGTPEVYVSGAFGKIAFANNDYDMFDDANGGGDVKYTGAFGGVSVGLVHDMDATETSVQLGYTMGAVALSADMDTYDLWNVSAAYTMGAVTGTLSTNEASNEALKVAYSANGMSASVKVDSLDFWELEAGYEANGAKVGFFTDKASAWSLKGSYDLGGGLSAEGGINASDDLFAGVSMSF
jgi:outer membrane protein OmpU